MTSPQDQMLLTKNIERWRIFVNLYYRNYRILHFLFSADQVRSMMATVRERADVEETDEMLVKLKDIEEYPFEQGRPTYLMKRPFVDSNHLRMTKSWPS